MTNQPKTEVEIDGKTWPLVQQWHFYKYADENGDWHVRESDSPLPTRPAPEATFAPTPHEPCEGVKLFTAQSDGGVELPPWCLEIHIDGDYAGTIFGDFGEIDDAVSQHGWRHPLKIERYLQFTPALTAFRDRIRAERKAKPEPGPTLGERARKVVEIAESNGAYTLSKLAAVVAELAEREARP